MEINQLTSLYQYSIIKGVFKGGRLGGLTPPHKKKFRFFLKSKGKEVERKRKENEKGWEEGGGGVNC